MIPSSLLFLFLAAPLADAPDTFVRFEVDSNTAVVVSHGGRILKPGGLIAAAPGPVKLIVRYHDGEDWREGDLVVTAERGMTSTFTLTVRVRMRTWLA